VKGTREDRVKGNREERRRRVEVVRVAEDINEKKCFMQIII
jgi:hypothetical protein